MAALTRRQYAEVVHRKLDDLAADLSTVASGESTEGDYTDAINGALRDCGLADVSSADNDAEIQAMLAGVEYYVLQRLLYKNVSKPSTQQGTGTGGLHLMVQTESLVKSLRVIIDTARYNYREALTAIGKKLSGASGMIGGAVQIDVEDDRMSGLVTGERPLPWLEEGYVG